MVSSVQQIPRPRNSRVPLAEAWAAAVDELAKIAPGEAAGGPITWLNLDRLEDRVAQHRKANAPPPPSPELVQAMGDFGDMSRQFNSVVLEIKNEQRWLERNRNGWKFRLLTAAGLPGGISPDCFTLPPLCPTGDAAPDFSSVWAARQAAKDLLPRMQWARGVLARIGEAQSFENLETGDHPRSATLEVHWHHSEEIDEVPFYSRHMQWGTEGPIN
jgi:hypothetical protein